MLNVKQGGVKYHFWFFGMTRPGIEPRSPGPLANTLTKQYGMSFILLFPLFLPQAPFLSSYSTLPVFRFLSPSAFLFSFFLLFILYSILISLFSLCLCLSLSLSLSLSFLFLLFFSLKSSYLWNLLFFSFFPSSPSLPILSPIFSLLLLFIFSFSLLFLSSSNFLYSYLFSFSSFSSLSIYLRLYFLLSLFFLLCLFLHLSPSYCLFVALYICLCLCLLLFPSIYPFFFTF